MSSISPDIVNVTITAETQTISRVGFGTPLLMSTEAATLQGPTAVEYGSVDEMLTTGGGPFSTGDKVVAMASAVFAQTPRPSKVVVGKRANTQTVTMNFTPVVKNLTEYAITINSETFTFTSSASADADEIVAGLVALINVGGQDVLSADVADVLNLQGADAPGGTATDGVLFTVSGYDRNLWSIVEDVTPDLGGANGVAEDLNVIRTSLDGSDDWYAVMLDTHGKAEIEALAQSSSISGNFKLLLASSPDSAILGSGSSDVCSVLQTASVEKANVHYHPYASASLPACRVGGLQLPKDPGSTNWRYQTPAGLDSYKLTTAEKNNALGKNAMVYLNVRGQNVTLGSQDASGSYLDVVRTIAWLTARLEENVFADLAASDKIPYTRNGLNVVEARVRETLLEGVRTGALAANFTVTLPDFDTIPSADKANRVLNNVTFQATVTGAIDSVVVNGTLTF